MAKDENQKTYPPTESYTTRKPQDSVLGIAERHPSYGTVSINYVTGDVPLFQSDVVNHHFVELSIHEAELHFDGEREWVFGDCKTLATVCMSAAQFAELITTPNRGTGTPCTIVNVQGDPIWDTRFGNRPVPPIPKPFADKFKEEGKERTRRMTEAMNRAKGITAEMLNGNANATKANLKVLQGELDRALTEINSNLPYVLESFEGHVEKRMQHAVTEFESYVGTSLKRMGLQSLQNKMPTLQNNTSRLLTNGENSGTIAN